MADQQDKKKEDRKALIRRAVRKVASTEAGIIVFKYLKDACHFENTTLSGNPQTHEVNTMASIAREFERKIYLGLRQAFTDEQKYKIEIQNNTKEEGASDD